MLDLTKPVQTRSGVAATIVATGVLSDIPGVAAGRFDGQTILARHSDDGGLHYHYPNGHFMQEDCDDEYALVNVPPEPTVTRRYHTFEMVGTASRGGSAINLGGIQFDSADAARAFADSWDAVLELTFTDDKLTGIAIA